MIHRHLHDILTCGIRDAANDPKILEDIFNRNYQISPNETAAIRTYFQNKGCGVINGYPRVDTDFPVIAIILAEEGEIDHFIGDSAGLVYDESDPDYRKEIKSTIWSHTHRFMICTEHPDITAYYYEIAKDILLDGQELLSGEDYYEFRMSGRDLAPDPRYIPEHIFVRELIFKCARPFGRVDRKGDESRYTSISGIHVDSSGSPSDVGDVKTNVIPYLETE